MKDINRLWNDHLNSGFPDEYTCAEVEGIDLVLLDADTAGCISTFIHNKGKLDLWRTAILGKCFRDLAIVNREINSNIDEYFFRLEHLAKLVLQDIIKKYGKNG